AVVVVQPIEHFATLPGAEHQGGMPYDGVGGAELAVELAREQARAERAGGALIDGDAGEGEDREDRECRCVMDEEEADEGGGKHQRVTDKTGAQRMEAVDDGP